MSEYTANKQLEENKQAPDLMAERKPLDLRDVKQGDKNDSSTWELV